MTEYKNERGRMIENSDRGITLAKPLAWTMLVSLVGAVWFGATTISDLSHSTRGVTDALSSVRNTSAGLDARIRAVEIAQASQTSDLRSIQAGIADIKSQLMKMEDGK